MKDKESVPRQMQPVYDAVVRITDEVCTERLIEEYAQFSRALAAALSRKRPSPLAYGRIETWACGIVYTLGSINFLFDKSQTPHLSATELCALFGLSKSTGAAKAKVIQDSLKIGPFDPRWSLPSKAEARAHSLPALQELFRRGLILSLP